jgi:phospholipase/lecithinase/hemolysin
MIWGLSFAAAPTHAAFSSIYIFGDSVSGTSSNTVSGAATNLYYGKRYTNGRTWAEVLAQRQGLGANSLTNAVWNFSSNNLSFFGHWSALMVTNVKNFVPPPNATNCLFVVWVCNADFVGDVGGYFAGPNLGPPSGTNLADWTTAINQHLTNHFRALTNLYAKGCRTLVAPNAVDIMVVPNYNASPSAYRAFVRQRIINFNTSFANMLAQVGAASPGLKIYSPDIFTLLDNVITNAAAYGLTNATVGGVNVSATGGTLAGVAINGLGTNYVFWGDTGDPSAKFHAVIADTAQQALSPLAITDITPVNISNQLTLANALVGAKGVVEFSANLATAAWQTNSFFTVSNVAPAVFVNPTNDMRFYRVKFPWQWSWP